MFSACIIHGLIKPVYKDFDSSVASCLAEDEFSGNTEFSVMNALINGKPAVLLFCSGFVYCLI